jgi:predicted nuclease of predicted toxin-antitoxin system
VTSESREGDTFDENLSPVLPRKLSDCYGERRMSECPRHGLEAAPDIAAWEYALRNEFAIVTKDSDFRHRSSLRGSPPKGHLDRAGKLLYEDGR